MALARWISVLLLITWLNPWTMPAWAAGESCPDGSPHVADSDLRACFPPIGDQDTIGWCYAYGAAAQLSCWAVRNRVSGVSLQNRQWVSAAAAALENNQARRQGEYARLQSRLKLSGVVNAQILALKERRAEAYRKLNDRESVLSASNAEYAGIKRQIEAGHVTTVSPPTQSLLERLVALRSADAAYHALEGDVNEFNHTISELTKSLRTDFDEPESGSAEDLLNRLAGEGLCLESQVNSADNGPGAKLDGDRLQLTFKTDYGKFLAQPTEGNRCIAARELHSVFSSIEVPEIENILSRAGEGDPIEELRSRSCVGHLVPLDRKPEVVPVKGTSAELGAQFKALLAQGTPVGISYHAEVFNLPPDEYGPAEKDPNTHYSVLVGQRYDCANHKTRFLLRNSWGPGACDTKRGNFRRYVSHPPVPYVQRETQIIRQSEGCYSECVRKQVTGDRRIKPNAQSEARLLGCTQGCDQRQSAAMSELNRPPFDCDHGDFVIDEDQLTMGLTAHANYLK